MLRYLPPVASPISAGALAAGCRAAVFDRDHVREQLARAVQRRFGAEHVALTASGTAALVLAIRAALASRDVAPGHGTVALPAYGCPDLIAAAVRAPARVRLYDIEPTTLSPDLDSLRAAVSRGVEAVVVAHLYGYPVDMAGVRATIGGSGAILIEDAAQGAAGSLGGMLLGGFGPLSVLSFGRGKGITGGRGGALLVTPDAEPALRSVVGNWKDRGHAGWGDLTRAGAQWLLGRPSWYRVPASIPGLHLGETIYHPAGEPRGLSRGAAAVVLRALASADADRQARAERAAWYERALSGLGGVTLVQPIPAAAPGYLRYPVLGSAVQTGILAKPDLGIVETYPRVIQDEPAARAVVWAQEPDTPGARETIARLVSLPTHAHVSSADASRVTRSIALKARMRVADRAQSRPDSLTDAVG